MHVINRKMKEIVKKIVQNDGRTIELRTGKLAKQADGSVELRMGNSVLLATVVSNKTAKDDVDFLPLTVDYREKFAADGRFPGGFLKREARPTDHEILIMRLVDRILRPYFPSDYHAETQIMLSLASHDKNVCPEALAGLGASAALAVSDIPFNGPISEVRVGRVDGEFIANPSDEQLEKSDLDMVIGASIDSVAMVEGEMKEISEGEMIEAIKFAHEEIKNHCKIQNEFTAEVKKEIKREYSHENHDQDLANQVMEFCYDKFYQIAKKALDKHSRSEQFSAVKEEFKSTLNEDDLASKAFMLNAYFKKAEKKSVRDMVLNDKVRLDGRSTTDIRPIWCEVDYLPSPHGSALFTRGETQALVVTTLGSKRDAQLIETLESNDRIEDHFMLHYNFPPYCVGETGRVMGVKRREVGHGRLARRGISACLPNLDEFPYTIRVVSEITESNGSSSMASVCGSSLSLMDAGVPLKAPVAGIAMGLVKDEDRFTVLTDILGDEDHLGDMDFKVAGTSKGINALQMDIKIDGITEDIMSIALKQAKDARLNILGQMNQVISEPNSASKNAPKTKVIKIPTDKIRDVIGKGGETIRGIVSESGTSVDVDDDGNVNIFANDSESFEKAVQMVKDVTAVPEVNKVYMGKVAKIVEFGAFVTIMPNQDGLLHVSEIAHERVEKVEDYLKEGEEVEVKVLGIDRGRIKLSRKVLIEKS